MLLVKKIIFFILISFASFCYGSLLCDEESEIFLTDIVNELKGALKYKQKINIYILNDKTLNAAATENGDIVVNAGAIINCKDVKELIAILAHEVSHISGCHIANFSSHINTFSKAGLVPAVIGAIASVVAANPAPLMFGAMTGETVTQKLAFSNLRQKENIADTKAVEAVTILGWPVMEGYVTLYEKFESQSIMYNEYFSTHPLSSSRLSKAKNAAQKEKQKNFSTESQNKIKHLEERFKVIKEKIKALTLSPEESFQLYNKTNANEYAKAISLYINKKYTDSIGICDKLLKNSPTNFIHIAEIKCLNMIATNQTKEAQTFAYKTLQNSKRHYRDLGMIFAETIIQNNNTKLLKFAISYIEKLSNIYSDDPSIINMLGNLYSISKEDDKSSLCLAKTYMMIGDIETAKVHANKTLKSPKSQIKQQAMDILNEISQMQQAA
ncbi:MAG: M48 family metalloprotease [Alphaproteobacteria bacterium]|nr:M48 family metalloprotease [Alphaproteobacteria bacterium]